MKDREAIIKEINDAGIALLSRYKDLQCPMSDDDKLTLESLDVFFGKVDHELTVKSTDIFESFRRIIKNPENTVEINAEQLKTLRTVVDKNNMHRTIQSYDFILNKCFAGNPISRTGKKVRVDDLIVRTKTGSMIFTNSVLPGFIFFLLIIRDGLMLNHYRIKFIKKNQQILTLEELSQDQKDLFATISNMLCYVNIIFGDILIGIDKMFLNLIADINKYREQIRGFASTGKADFAMEQKAKKRLVQRKNYLANVVGVLQNIVKDHNSEYKLPSYEVISKKSTQFDCIDFKVSFLYHCLDQLSKNFYQDFEVKYSTLIGIDQDKMRKEAVISNNEIFLQRFKKISATIVDLYPTVIDSVGEVDDTTSYIKEKLENYLNGIEELLIPITKNK